MARTAKVPLSASPTSVAAASPLRPVRSTLVAPILPEPMERMSRVPASRVMINPNGIEPQRYPNSNAAA
jgi:lambda repressor-like predicted transcriptional regulator